MTQKLLSLFRAPHNMDTAQIAAHLGWPESRVYNLINAERREERAVPVTWKDVEPKERKHAPTAKLRKLVPFAGYDGKEERI